MSEIVQVVSGCGAPEHKGFLDCSSVSNGKFFLLDKRPADELMHLLF